MRKSRQNKYTGLFYVLPFVIGLLVFQLYPFLASFFYSFTDLSIANENLWLETDALGLGGVWLGIAPIEERMHEVESVLQMPAGHHAFAIFALGYPAESKPQQDRFDPARIHYAE